MRIPSKPPPHPSQGFGFFGWRSWTRAKLAPTRGVRFQVSSIVMLMTQIVMMMTQIVMVVTQIVMVMTQIVMMMTKFQKNTVFFK